MYNLSKPGHLLAFGKEGKDYFFYLYIMKPEKPFASLVVLEGVRELAGDLNVQLEIHEFSELKRVALKFEIGEELINVPLEIFVDRRDAFKKGLFLACLENLFAGHASVFPVREIGAVARDSSFVRSRENSRRIIEDYILQNKNVIIDAPRRAGKTSFVCHLAEEDRLKDHKITYLDMERATGPQQFAAMLITALEEGACKTAMERTKKEMLLIKELDADYKSGVEALLKEQSSKGKVVLAFDECSFMLEEMLKKSGEKGGEANKKEVVDFLAWFKDLRLSNKNVRFVFSGSIKFAVFENELDEKGFFDDCEEYSLKPMDKSTAVNLVEGLFYAEEIYPPDYITDHIIQRTTPYVPYFLQIVTDEMVKYYRAKRKFPKEEEIEEVIENELIYTNCRRYLDQFLVNLRRYNPVEERGAKVLLNHLALTGETKRNTLEALYVQAAGDEKRFDKVLALLEYDFYIAEKDGRYFFANEIIKNWWKVNFAISGERS